MDFHALEYAGACIWITVGYGSGVVVTVGFDDDQAAAAISQRTGKAETPGAIVSPEMFEVLRAYTRT